MSQFLISEDLATVYSLLRIAVILKQTKTGIRIRAGSLILHAWAARTISSFTFRENVKGDVPVAEALQRERYLKTGKAAGNDRDSCKNV